MFEKKEQAMQDGIEGAEDTDVHRCNVFEFILHNTILVKSSTIFIQKYHTIIELPLHQLSRL